PSPVALHDALQMSEAAAGVAADVGDRGGGDPHDELHVRAATGAVVDEVADLRRAVVAAAGAEPRDPDRAASGARPGAGVAGLLQAPGQEAVAPRVAEAAVGVARDLAEPPVVLRVVVAGLAVADLGGGHLDHALHAHGASSSSASGSKPPSGCTSSSTNSAPASCRIAASRCACRSVAVRSSVASHSAVGSGSGVGSVIGCSNAKAPRSAGLVLFDGGGLSRRPWWARGSGRPGRTRRSRRALRPLRALLALVPLRALRPLLARRPGGTGLPSRTGLAIGPIGPVGAVPTILAVHTREPPGAAVPGRAGGPLQRKRGRCHARRAAQLLDLPRQHLSVAAELVQLLGIDVHAQRQDAEAGGHGHGEPQAAPGRLVNARQAQPPPGHVAPPPTRGAT